MKPKPLSAGLRHLFGAVLLLVAVAASAARIEGHDYEDRLSLAGTELVLNGVGLRSVAWLKGFTAGLYLTERATAAPKALALRGPKRLQMRMLLEVETKEFSKAFEASLRRNNTEAERDALKARVAQFDRNMAIVGKVRKGDVINLDFVPGAGLVTLVNGQPRGTTIVGEDLYASVLKIFIGDRPVDRQLKTGLLAGLPS
jgi:hypothetical protein